VEPEEFQEKIHFKEQGYSSPSSPGPRISFLENIFFDTRPHNIQGDLQI